MSGYLDALIIVIILYLAYYVYTYGVPMQKSAEHVVVPIPSNFYGGPPAAQLALANAKITYPRGWRKQ